VTVHLSPVAKASDQHPAPMALADADSAHGEIAAGFAIPFQRRALAEPWPPSPEPIFESDGLPRCIARSWCPRHPQLQC